MAVEYQIYTELCDEDVDQSATVTHYLYSPLFQPTDDKTFETVLSTISRKYNT